MRYPDGGGLSAEGRARRERARLLAVQMFEQDMDPVEIAGMRHHPLAEISMVSPPPVWLSSAWPNPVPGRSPVALAVRARKPS
jgi:hypothetical protein